jgi:hypothetical protein
MPPEQKFPLMPVPQASTGLQKSEEYVDDMMVEATDLYVPTLKVLQGLSDEVKAGKARPGKFWNPYTNKELDSPQSVIVVFHQKSRAMMESGPMDSEKRERCMSFDLVNGTVYGSCDECQYKEWNKKVPPLCSMSHVFIIFTPEGPLAIRFRKKSEKDARQFITSKQVQKQNWWTFTTVVEIKKQIGVDNTGRPAEYYAPTIAWDKTQTVSEELRTQARAFNAVLGAAQAAGKLKADAVEEGEA